MVSLLGMFTLGVVLVVTMANLMRAQALRDGAEAAQTIGSYASEVVPPEAFGQGILEPADRASLEASVSGFADRLVGLRLWTPENEVLYDSQSATTGFPDLARLDRATLEGIPDARVITDIEVTAHGGSERELLDVYVPIEHDGQVIGAAEVMLDYTQTAKALHDAGTTVTAVIGGGLAVLWLLLFRTVLKTSRRLHASALENARLALLDSLTGLPNRRMLADRLERAIATAQVHGTRVGLVLLDVDRFKDINDSLGHDRGDELLEQVAERLRGALRDDDIVARLGGDEFAVLLPDVRTIENAERLAHRVRAVFGTPFTLGDMPLHVETSIGVACLPDHADDASSLMRKADVAMYTAKTHRLGVAVYSPDEDNSSPARLVLLGDLHRALTADVELEMHYQPKIDLRTGKTAGYEALMRWRHPTRGLLPPDLFIPLAEQSGLIHDLTRYALTSTVAQLATWRAEGRHTPVAVNLSAHDVTSLTVAELIETLLEAHDLPAELLEVEITETALVADPSRVVPVLKRLSALGVRVAIDDFGIGNTSISQLIDLPVDMLKIDRVFVSGLCPGGREGSAVVVKAMVDLAHSFGLRVVAEGVEDTATADLLRDMNVDQAQGFLYSKAVRAADLPAPNTVYLAEQSGPGAALAETLALDDTLAPTLPRALTLAEAPAPDAALTPALAPHDTAAPTDQAAPTTEGGPPVDGDDDPALPSATSAWTWVSPLDATGDAGSRTGDVRNRAASGSTRGSTTAEESAGLSSAADAGDSAGLGDSADAGGGVDGHDSADLRDSVVAAVSVVAGRSLDAVPVGGPRDTNSSTPAPA